MKHFTYANVMSTIAVFAALTTGGSYAASKWMAPANSVTSRAIKNGQVTMADLHSSVRKKLGKISSGGGGAIGASWSTISIFGNAGDPLWQCYDFGCNDSDRGYVGRIKTPGLPSSGRVRFRVTGSLNNTGSVAAGVRISVRTASTLAGLDNPSNYTVLCFSDDGTNNAPIQPGGSLDLATACSTRTTPAVAAAQYLGVFVEGFPRSEIDGINDHGQLTGTPKLEVQTA